MEYNLPATSAKYAEVARLLGEDTPALLIEAAARKVVDHVRELPIRVGISTHLREFGAKAKCPYLPLDRVDIRFPGVCYTLGLE